MAFIGLARIKPLVHVKATEKVCKGCPDKGLQPIGNFCKTVRNKDGKADICRACCKKKKQDLMARKAL